MLVSACFPMNKPSTGERLFLAVGSSLCVTPFVPFALNYVGPGITLNYAAPGIMVVMVLMSAVALVRRYDAGDERYSFGAFDEVGKNADNIANGRESARMHSWDSYNYVLAALFVFVVLFLLAVLYVLLPLAAENRARIEDRGEIVELFISPSEGAGDYPHYVTKNESAKVRVGVGYGLGEERSFSIVAQIVNKTRGMRVSGLQYVETWDTVFIFACARLGTEGYERNFTFGPGDGKWEEDFSFGVDSKGEYMLEFLLFFDEDAEVPARGVSVWVRVT